MISEDNILQFIDLEYETILDEIQSTKEELMPEWTDDSDTDFGNLILTYVAMLADDLSWKIDYSVNECIPALARTMKAMYKHCKWIGYKPRSNTSARATLEIKFINNGGSIVLPKGTQFTMEDMVNGDYIIYELDESVDCSASDDTPIDELYSIECEVIQGETVSETIGYSDGLSDQEFYITFSPYIEGSLEVECYNPAMDTSEIYKTNLNNSFIGMESDDTVIVLEQIDSELIKVKFGDGYNGKIPFAGCQLIANYRIGGGVVGNRPIGVINTPVNDMPSNFISVSNVTEAIGGEDAQNVDEIKKSVEKGEHKIVYTLIREQDFDLYLSKQSEIEKFRSCKGADNSSLTNSYIWLFIKPYNDIVFDSSYKEELLKSINKLKGLTDIVEIKDCTPLNVQINIEANTNGLTNIDNLSSIIRYSVKDYVDSLGIGSKSESEKDEICLHKEDLKDLVKKQSGIDNKSVKITKLCTKEDSLNDVEQIVLELGQLFTIENLETDITVEIS